MNRDLEQRYNKKLNMQIKSDLKPGDQTYIAKLTGKTFRCVHQTLKGSKSECRTPTQKLIWHTAEKVIRNRKAFEKQLEK